MESTERLYYSRPRLVAAEATVLAVEGEAGRPALVLDRTLFYPEGGGQPCDLGTIGGIPLLGVEEEGGRILHRLAEAPRGGIAPGGRVLLALDAGRRRDHSQQHSGQHLLSATLLRVAGAPTVSFHLGEERCTIDVDRPSLDEGELEAAAAEAERAIASDFALSVHVCPPEDLASFPLRRRPPEGEGAIRVVEIDGLDYTPCCGTHVASTAEIRALGILGAERYKGMTRVSFVAGDRAAADYLAVSRLARSAARALGSSVAALPEAAAKAAARMKAAETAAGALVRERAALEARLELDRLRGAAAAGGGPRCALASFRDRDAAAAQESAKAFAALGLVGLAASLTDLVAVAVAPDEGAGLAARLGPIARVEGGKGGGGGGYFRASFAGPAALEAFLAAAARELGA